MGCTIGSDYILGPFAPIIPRSQQRKKWGLGGGLHSLSASNVIHRSTAFLVFVTGFL